MMRFARDFRLIPLVLFATISLFALKMTGLIFNGGYTLTDTDDITGSVTTTPPPSNILITHAKNPVNFPHARTSWASEMLGYPDITGSVPDKGAKPAADAEKADAKAASGPETQSEGKPEANAASKPRSGEPIKIPQGREIPLNPGPAVSPGERAILERLQQRREEIEARARELDMRENLVKAAEKQIETRSDELKQLDARKGPAGSETAGGGDSKRFKNLVTMYETMKAKDAAKIFNRLELGVLVQVSTKINPRAMAEILAQMSPEVAEKLTIALAGDGDRQNGQPSKAELPKIEGH
jgi:flagellar motility protein MotE (MotC chaperone)